RTDGVAHPDPGDPAGDLQRPAHWLLADPARHHAGRAVRLAARPRLPADDGDRPQRRADDPRDRRADLAVRRDHQLYPAGNRQAPASRVDGMTIVDRDLGAPLHHQIYLV